MSIQISGIDMPTDGPLTLTICPTGHVYTCEKRVEAWAYAVTEHDWKSAGENSWRCPSCGHVVYTAGSWEHPHERSMYFCENCGADLR